jgi:hypothetical protein
MRQFRVTVECPLLAYSVEKLRFNRRREKSSPYRKRKPLQAKGAPERVNLLTLDLQLRHKRGVSGILELIRIWRKISVLAISSFSTE